MFDIIFSIPIHHRLEVAVDQICNFLYFNPNSGIVFHISQGYKDSTSLLSKDEFIEIINKTGRVFLNTESVRTGFADIIQAHMSNFDFIKRKIEFKYFAICASNELFIKTGLYDRIKGSECGFRQCTISNSSEWKYGEFLFRDEKFLDYIKEHFSKEGSVNFTNPEGQYFRKELFETVSSQIRTFYSYEQMKEAYPREEIYFSTLALDMLADKKKDFFVGNPFTYSSYHFRLLWDTTRREIENLMQNGEFYSVKRVNREINDCIRIYLRHRYGYEEKEKMFLSRRIKLKKYNNILIDMLSYKKNLFQLCGNWKKIPKYFTVRWKA